MGRVHQRRHTPSLEGREVLAHAVHLADGGAGRQQQARGLLLVGQGHARRRRGQQCRAAARHDADQQRVRRRAATLRGQRPARGRAAGVRHRVPSLQQARAAQPAGAAHLAALRHRDAAAEPVLQQRLHAARHGRRRLAHPYQPQLAEPRQVDAQGTVVGIHDEGVALQTEPRGDHFLGVDAAHAGGPECLQGRAPPGRRGSGRLHGRPPCTITSRYQRALRFGVRRWESKSTRTRPKRLR